MQTLIIDDRDDPKDHSNNTPEDNQKTTTNSAEVIRLTDSEDPEASKTTDDLNNESAKLQTFEDQRPDEIVQFTFRRHWLTLKRGILISSFILFIGILLLCAWPGNSAIFWIFLAILALAALIFGYFYLLWYFSIYIITNQRIRQVSQKSLFKKSVVDLSLTKVESTSVHIPGFRATLLNYGTILVQTTAGTLTISKVKNPKKIHAHLENVLRSLEKS